MNKTIVSGLVMAVAAATFAPVEALAQRPNRIEQFKDWGAYNYQDTSGAVCYVLSVPKEKMPKDRDHGEVYFLVSRKVGAKVTYEPQVEVGYAFKDQSTVTVEIDDKKFVMFTNGNNAWMSNAADEPALVDAMRGGRQMVVTGESRRGTKTTYSYSLSGISAALKEISNCK